MPRPATRLTKAVRKYLERHAEPEAEFATALTNSETPYPAIVVIPAYGEHETLLDTLASVPLCEHGKPLVVLVVNQRDESPDWADDANRTVLDHLRMSPLNQRAARTLGPNIELHSTPGFDMVLIDRTLPGQRLPKRQGVGLARKIGADFATALWAGGGCISPWVHCTDADVSLPSDYFDRCASHTDDRNRTAETRTEAALLFDFRHAAGDSPSDDTAILEYEIYLRYYVLGLRSAGSPFAFHSIGSTLAIHANSYAQVRGFPKREAAEDFHLLAKLAKVGDVTPLRGEPILISGRESERVPFGTGHAVLQGHARAERGEPFVTYDPRSFAWLGVWLATLDSMSEQPAARVSQLLEFHAAKVGAADGVNDGVEPSRLERVLESCGALDSAEKTLQNKGSNRQSLNQSFDALASLQLIHALRDEIFPDIPLGLALERASFIDCDPGASLEAQRTALAQLELGVFRANA